MRSMIPADELILLKMDDKTRELIAKEYSSSVPLDLKLAHVCATHTLDAAWLLRYLPWKVTRVLLQHWITQAAQRSKDETIYKSWVVSASLKRVIAALTDTPDLDAATEALVAVATDLGSTIARSGSKDSTMAYRIALLSAQCIIAHAAKDSELMVKRTAAVVTYLCETFEPEARVGYYAAIILGVAANN